MRQRQEFSDGFINAFVDGQLMPEEKARISAQLADDEDFNRRVCELRKIRDLIRFAYRDLPAPVQQQRAAASVTPLPQQRGR